MIYTFEAEDGEKLDLVYPPAEVPSIGEWICVPMRPNDGRGTRFRRTFSGRIGEGTIAQRNKYPYVSNAHAPGLPGTKTVYKNGKAKPLIESARHEREICAMNNMVRD